MTSRRGRLVSALTLGVSLILGAPAARAWKATLAGSQGANDAAVAVVVDAGGMIVSAGTVHDADLGEAFTVVKATPDGRELWRYRFAGTFRGSGEAGGAQAASVALAPNGDVVAAGAATNVGAGFDIVVVRVDGATGTERWQRTIGGSGHDTDRASKVVVDAQGNVFVAGRISDRPNDQDFIVLKLAGATGEDVWRRVLSGNATTSFDDANALALTPDGDVVAGGCLENDQTDDDMVVVRLNGQTGATVWMKVIAAPGNDRDCANAIAVAADGTVAAAGKLGGTNPNGEAFAVVLFSGTTGTELWRMRTVGGGIGFDVANAVAFAPDGDVHAAGSLGHDVSEEDLAAVRVRRSDGVLLWSRFVNDGKTPAGRDEAIALLVQSNGAVIAAGNVGDQPEAVAWTAAGDLLWTSPIASLPSFTGFLDAAPGAAGTVHLAGLVNDVATAEDYVVITLDTLTGEEARRFTIAGTGTEGFDGALGVAVDGAGDVLAAGVLDNAGTFGDFTVAKFAGSNGALLWSKSLDGGGSGFDIAQSIAVDATGDAVVAGSAALEGNQEAWRILKLASADGSERWRVDVTGVEGGEHGAEAVALDAAGNVAVAGFLTEKDNNNQVPLFTVLGLAGTTGMERWRLQLKDNGTLTFGNAHALAFDPAGDVLAVGSFSEHLFDPERLTVAKAGGADGQERWRVAMHDLIDDQVSSDGLALSVDGLGDVVAVGTARTDPQDRGVAIKLAAADGKERWRYRLEPEQVDAATELTAVVTLPSGDVVASGRVGSEDNGPFPVLVRLDAATGTERWRRTLTVARTFGAAPIAVVGDDVLVASQADNQDNGNNAPVKAIIVRLAGATGEDVWRRDIAELPGDFESPRAIAVDLRGDPVVAGDGTQPASSSDFLVRKVSGATGSEEFCGDGVVQASETCDDGNVTNGDCCTVACALEADPVCQPIEPDDPDVGDRIDEVCSGEQIPKNVSRALLKADELTKSAVADTKPKRAARRLRRADRLLRQAGKRIARAAKPRGKKHAARISAACAAGLKDLVLDLQAAVKRARPPAR